MALAPPCDIHTVATHQVEIDQADDFEAGYLGGPLCQQENEEEDWMQFVNWDLVDLCSGNSHLQS